MKTRRATLALTLVALLGCSADPTALTDAQITFDNQTTLVITWAGFSDCDDLSGFGSNRLQSDLRPGQQVTFATLAGCWDLEVVFADGRKKEEWGMRVASGEHKVWHIAL